jgi:ubiquinone/menaquinone biosynthesis C-methylase UbiE
MIGLEKHIASFFKGETPKRILDVGGGAQSLPLLRKTFGGAEIFTINIDKKALNEAKECGAKAFFCDAHDMGIFSKEYFDLIYSGEVLEHLFYPEKFLRESWRVLKKGGCMILDPPNLAAWHNRMLLLFGFMPSSYSVSSEFRDIGIPSFFNKKQRQDHPRVFTVRALKEIMKATGFEIEGIKVVNNTYEKQPFRRIRGIAGTFLPHTWRECIIIKVRKK